MPSSSSSSSSGSSSFSSSSTSPSLSLPSLPSCISSIHSLSVRRIYLRLLVFSYIAMFYPGTRLPVVPHEAERKFPKGYTFFFIYRTCMRRAPARSVHAWFVQSRGAKLLRCCFPSTWPARDHGAIQRQTRLGASKIELHTSHYTFHILHFTLRTWHFISAHLTSVLVI